MTGMVNEQWTRVRTRLRAEVGEAAFLSWLKPLALDAIGDDAVRMVLPTRFMRDWVMAHYAERLRLLWSGENPAIRAVEIIVASGTPAANALSAAGMQGAGMQGAGMQGAGMQGAGPSNAPPALTGFTKLATANPVAANGERAPLRSAAEGEASLNPASVSASLDPRFTFENFVVGKPNEFAFAAARRIAESATSGNGVDAIAGQNPLFLYGGVGLGKTHLMHAIAWEIRRRDPSRRVIYLSAEKFMYQFIRALRYRGTVEFKEQFRSVDVLMIDDVQFISGKDSTQEEFFHTFNALVDQNRQVVISADKSPHDLEGMEERLRSRLGWGLVADIHPTNYELRLGILQSKAELMGAEQLGQSIPPKVLEFLAHKIQSNVRELEGALNRIVAHGTLIGRPITLETTQEVLHDLLRANDRRVTIEEIQKRVAEHYNIRLADMGSARRARVVARPRQVAMYLAKLLTARSLPEIGRKFGGRDHTTVMHAVRKIEELKASDPTLAEDVELLRRMLEC